MRPALRGLSALVLVAAPLLASGGAQAATPRDALVMALNIDGVITLDNAQIGEIAGNEVFTNSCDSLLTQDRADTTKLLPKLAESWSVSEDGLTYTFHIRPGMKHASGNPVTAEDFAWSIRRTLWLNFGNAAQFTDWGFTAANVEQRVRAADEHTLLVTVDKPYPPGLFLYVMAGRQGAALDKVEAMKHVVGNDHANAWLKTHTACVGPYGLRTWNAGETIILERNDDYWGPKPALRRVVIRNVTESAAQRLQLAKGDIDIARGLNSEDLAGLEGDAGSRLVQIPMNETVFFGFNTSDPILSNPKVREAFRWMIDYQGLQATVMKYGGIARATPVALGHFGALSREEGMPFHLDLARAKALLAEAGYPDGFSKDLITYAYSPYVELSQQLQANAAKIGVKLTVTPLVSAQLLARNRSREFDIATLNWGASYPDADSMLSRHATNPDNRLEARQTMYPAWRSAWQENWFNDAVAQARMERDVAKRQAEYHEIGTRLMHEGPMAYMFQAVRNARVANTVKAIVMNEAGVYYATAVK